MMNRMGALLFFAVAAQALPLRAEDAARSGANQPAPAQTIASQGQNGGAQSDATGSIDKGAQSRVTVSPVDPGRAMQAPSPGGAPASYEEAFENWRACAVAHQNVANPPPQCEPLRAALRRAMGARPRGYVAVETRPRS